MKEGDVVITKIPQTDGKLKNRPVLLLREMPPPFNDYLVCGVSTQLHLRIENFDEIINTDDDDFVASGLKQGSLIRLSFLAVLSKQKIIGTIGSIDRERHYRLLKNLSNYIIKKEENA